MKARIAPGGLEQARVEAADLEYVAALVADPARYEQLEPALLVAVALGIREADGRSTDEGLLVETAFHKFPNIFAYRERPEFPDTERVRAGLRDAWKAGLVSGFALTTKGREAVAAYQGGSALRRDASASYRTGAFKLAERIEASPAYAVYSRTGSLAASKGDELFRAVRLPPTTDTQRIVAVLETSLRELRRIDKGEVITYLQALAGRHNPDVAARLTLVRDTTGGTEVDT